MASSATRPRVRPSVRHRPSEPRFDRQLGKILEHATEVFCKKDTKVLPCATYSRHRHVSRRYVSLLWLEKPIAVLVQKHTFLDGSFALRDRLSQVRDPEEGVRIFIHNHLEYFLEHQRAMKVLSHEDDVLKGAHGREIAHIKRGYYRICRELLDRYKKEKGLEFDSRTAVLSLFGMMNWIYTWYNPRLDGKADRLAQDMSKIFFRGIGSSD